MRVHISTDLKAITTKQHNSGVYFFAIHPTKMTLYKFSLVV